MRKKLTKNELTLLMAREFQKEKTPPLSDREDFHFQSERWEGLDVEIGCGVGLHPIRYALKNPTRHLIAIEHTTEKFQKFKRRYQNHQTPANLTPVHANAISWLAHTQLPQALDRIFLLYPNPYPKPSDWRKRWVYQPFMSYLIELLHSSGELTVATNLGWYADEVIHVLTEGRGLRLARHHMISKDAEGRTHFEKKYLLRGEECQEMTFVKS